MRRAKDHFCETLNALSIACGLANALKRRFKLGDICRERIGVQLNAEVISPDEDTRRNIGCLKLAAQ